MIPVDLWETSCKSISLPVDRKYKKGNQEITVELHYLIQNVNFGGLM
jgi:hypothetical protein